MIRIPAEGIAPRVTQAVPARHGRGPHGRAPPEAALRRPWRRRAGLRSARRALGGRALDVDVELLALLVDLAQPALPLHLDAQLLQQRLLRELAIAHVELERVARVAHVGAA